VPAGFRILPGPSRPSPAIVAALAGLQASLLSDNMSRLQGAGASMLRPMHRGGTLAGPAFTVKVAPGDNLMVHKAIDLAAPGDVIVVDAGGHLEQAIIGEIMSSWAAKRGVAGFVIDGAIRDAAALAEGSFPVYARGASHRGPYKDGPGEINVPATPTASLRFHRPTPRRSSPARARRSRRKKRRSRPSPPASSTARGSTKR
jgi:regulator of RNase E activity RraA